MELDGYSANVKWDVGHVIQWLSQGLDSGGLQHLGHSVTMVTPRGRAITARPSFWPPDPLNGAITNTTTLKSYLTGLGITMANASTLSGLRSGTHVDHAENLVDDERLHDNHLFRPRAAVASAPIYYAVCRLFNRAYPAGSTNGAFTADRRVRFFGTNNNTLLFNSSGSLNLPGSSTYTINYNAILA